MSMTIVLVRHGQTVYNSERRLQGDEDAPGEALTAVGRTQAEQAGLLLRQQFGNAIDNAALYTSPLKRCIETLNGMGIPSKAIVDPELKERCLGPFTGQVVDRQVIQSLKNSKESSVETLEELMRRSRRVLNRISRELRDLRTGSLAVLLTHGGFISSVARWACPNQKFASVGNGNICTLTIDHDNKWAIHEWNASFVESANEPPSFGGRDFG
jgi:broad specificity phosphatase PhoE